MGFQVSTWSQLSSPSWWPTLADHRPLLSSTPGRWTYTVGLCSISVQPGCHPMTHEGQWGIDLLARYDRRREGLLGCHFQPVLQLWGWLSHCLSSLASTTLTDEPAWRFGSILPGLLSPVLPRLLATPARVGGSLPGRALPCKQPPHPRPAAQGWAGRGAAWASSPSQTRSARGWAHPGPPGPPRAGSGGKNLANSSLQCWPAAGFQPGPAREHMLARRACRWPTERPVGLGAGGGRARGGGGQP